MAITSKTTALCPRCNVGAKGIKAIKEVFGTRMEYTNQTPQSYCKECRKEHAAARKEAALTLPERYRLATGDNRKRSVQHMRKALGL